MLFNHFCCNVKGNYRNALFLTAVRQSRDESFLIYSNAKLGQIKAISTDPDKPEEVIPPITDLLRPVAVDYDAKFQYIYYSDALNHRIGRRRVDDTGPGTKDFITEGKAI